MKVIDEHTSFEFVPFQMAPLKKKKHEQYPE